MILFIGGFALGVVSGMALLHFTVIKNIEKSRVSWRNLAKQTMDLNLSLLTKLFTHEKPVIKAQEKPVFRSESEKGKKSAKVSRSNAGRVR